MAHKIVNLIYLKIRHRLAQDCLRQSPFSSEIEVDESYFGAKRTKGKRGRGAGNKTVVFGIYKLHGKVFTEILKCPFLVVCQTTLTKVQRSEKRYFQLGAFLHAKSC